MQKRISGLFASGLILLSFFNLSALGSDTAPKKGILLIGNPRSLTSVFELYMHQRGDFSTHFEPVIASYFKNFLIPEENKKAVIANDVLTELVNNQTSSFFIKEQAFVFFKDAFNGLDFLKQFTSQENNHVVFIIREPYQTRLSFYKLFKKSPISLYFKGSEVIDYQKIESLYNFVKHITGKEPILIEADSLAKNPEKVLSEFCHRLEIPFSPEQLKWKTKPEHFPAETEGWFEAVRQTQSFQLPSKRHSIDDPEILDEDKEQLLQEIEANRIVYNRLIKHAI